MIAQPPHPALVTATQPSTQYVHRRRGRIAVPWEDAWPARRLDPGKPECDRTREGRVTGGALRAVMDVITVASLAPVGLHERDAPDQIVRKPPFRCRPLKDLVSRAGKIAGDAAEDIRVPPWIIGAVRNILTAEFQVTRNGAIVSGIERPGLPRRPVHLRRGRLIAGQRCVGADRPQPQVPARRRRRRIRRARLRTMSPLACGHAGPEHEAAGHAQHRYRKERDNDPAPSRRPFGHHLSESPSLTFSSLASRRDGAAPHGAGATASALPSSTYTVEFW